MSIWVYFNNTNIQKFEVKMFLKEAYAHQGCIYLIKNTVKNSYIV